MRDLHAAAVEARLREDHDKLLKIALEPGCPPDLLRRLAGIGLEALTNAVLVHPDCPEAALAEVLPGATRLQKILIAIHPRAGADLLHRLACFDLVSVGAAVLVNPAARPPTLERIGSKIPAFEQLCEAIPRLPGVRSWRHLAKLLPAPWESAKERRKAMGDQVNSELGSDPDTPFAILIEHAKVTGQYLALIQDNPTARGRIDEVVARIGRRKLRHSHFAAMLTIPSLSIALAEHILRRILASKPQIWTSTDVHRRMPVGLGVEQPIIRPATQLLLLDRATGHPVWGEAPPDLLLELSSLHPRAYLGWLANPALADDTKAALRRKVRGLGHKLVSRWPLLPLLRTEGASPDPAGQAAQLARLPLGLARGVAARADLTPPEVKALLARRSKGIDAALIRGGYLTAQQIRQRADVNSELMRMALASCAATPPEILDKLIAQPSSYRYDSAVALTLLQSSSLSVAQRRRVLGSGHFQRFYYDDRPELLEAAAEHLHPPLDAADKAALSAGDLLPCLLRRRSIPLAARQELLSKRLQSQPECSYLQLLLPEVEPARIEAFLADREGSDDSVNEAPWRWLFSGELFYNPSLSTEQLSRGARLVLRAARRGGWFGRWDLVCHHPSATRELLAELLDMAGGARGVLLAVARAPVADGALLDEVLDTKQPGYGSAEVRELVASHAQADPDFLEPCLLRTGEKIQELAAAHSRVSRQAILRQKDGAERQQDGLRRALAWVELGPDRSEALAVLADAGVAIDPVTDDEIEAAFLDPEVSAEAGAMVIDVLTLDAVGQALYSRLAKHFCVGDGRAPVLACTAVARHSDSLPLLEWLAEHGPKRVRPLLAFNPAMPPANAVKLLAPAGPAYSRYHVSPYDVSREDIAGLLERAPEAEQYLAQMYWYWSYRNSLPGGASEGQLEAQLLAALRERTRWYSPLSILAKCVGDSTSAARRYQAAALVLAWELMSPGVKSTLGAAGWKLVGRVFGLRSLAWALISDRRGANRPVVLTAVNALLGRQAPGSAPLAGDG